MLSLNSEPDERIRRCDRDQAQTTNTKDVKKAHMYNKQHAREELGRDPG